MRDAFDVQPGVSDRVVEVGEDVVLVCEVPEGADGVEDAAVRRAWALEQHGDVTMLELVDDLAQGLGTGGVEDLEIREPEDDHTDVPDRDEFGQEPLRRSEEERSVEPVGDDVVVEQSTLVVGVDRPDDEYRLGLFVVPVAGTEVDEELTTLIASTLKSRLSPRHVPDEIVAAPAIPHTINGKRLEVPVKKLLMGRPLNEAVSTSSIDDPDVLTWFARFAADRFGTD